MPVQFDVAEPLTAFEQAQVQMGFEEAQFASATVEQVFSDQMTPEMPEAHPDFDPAGLTTAGLIKACDHFARLAALNPEMADAQAGRAIQTMREEAEMRQSGMDGESIRKQQLAAMRERHKEKAREREKSEPKVESSQEPSTAKTERHQKPSTADSELSSGQTHVNERDNTLRHPIYNQEADEPIPVTRIKTVASTYKERPAVILTDVLAQVSSTETIPPPRGITASDQMTATRQEVTRPDTSQDDMLVMGIHEMDAVRMQQLQADTEATAAKIFDLHADSPNVNEPNSKLPRTDAAHDIESELGNGPASIHDIDRIQDAMPRHPSTYERIDDLTTEEIFVEPDEDSVLPKPVDAEFSGTLPAQNPTPPELTAEQPEDEQLLVAELLQELSAEVPVLQPATIERVAEPIAEILQAVRQNDEENVDEEVTLEDTPINLATELQLLFKQEEIVTTDEEFDLIVGALLESDEKQDIGQQYVPDQSAELTADVPNIRISDYVPSGKQAGAQVQPQKEIIEPDLRDETFGVKTKLERHLKAMEPEEAVAVIIPLKHALTELKALSTEPATPPAELEEAEAIVLTVLHEILTQAKLEATDEQIREIIYTLIDSYSQDELEDFEDLGFTQLFGTHGTFEGRQFNSTQKKYRHPVHNFIGKVILLSFKKLQEKEKPLAMAA